MSPQLAKKIGGGLFGLVLIALAAVIEFGANLLAKIPSREWWE